MPRFALDQNFPTPIINVLREYLVEAELVSIRDIDSRMPMLADWEILLALHRHSAGWDGLVTTDSSMVKLPRELSVLLQTKLTLIVAQAAGHDPLKATGLVLAHLPSICKQTKTGTAQLWLLSAKTRPPHDPWKLLATLAKRYRTKPNVLYKQHQLTKDELARNPLESDATP